MRKIGIYILFGICVLFSCVNVVMAGDDGFVSVSDETSFDECIKNAGTCRIMSNLNFTSKKEIDKEVVIDLNGFIIEPTSDLKLHSGLIHINRGGKLTINDSKGSGKISTGTNSEVWAAIQVLKDNNGSETAEVTINGGSIEGYYYGITGNGNYHNSKIVINGGKVIGLNKEDSAGIYHPQKGELIINNGVIQGGTGIEIRAGSLVVNNGEIEGIAPKFVKMVNKSGTTTNGVGIAVAQHVTKEAIDVTVNGGNIKGEYAFYEWNPHENSREDLNKITIHLNGGNYTGLATGVHAVYSEDFKDFITGGKYNTDVSEYLTDNAKLAASTLNSDIVMDITPNKSNFPKILVGIVIIVSVGCLVLVCKKKNLLFFNY